MMNKICSNEVGFWTLERLTKFGADFHRNFPEAHASEGMLALLGAIYLALAEKTDFDSVDQALSDLRKRTDK